MSTVSTGPNTLTAEDLMELPDDGVERDIIRGELREYPMTRRSPDHTITEAAIARLLGNWLETQPSRGEQSSAERPASGSGATRRPLSVLTWRICRPRWPRGAIPN